MGPLRALLASSAALLAPTPQDLVTPGAGLVSLPEGRVAEMLAGLAADVAPSAPGAPWPAWSERSARGWGGEGPWRRWVELVRAESTARAGSPGRRAELAVLARLQGRDGDAWAHLLACAAEPGRVAALLPLFSPGVPQEWLGREDALPDGALLSPALPPTDDARAGLRLLAGTKIERRDFALGAARCSLAVSVDRDGLEVSLRHLGGDRSRVRVLAPLPRGVDPGLVFADWEKLPGHAGPVEFVLDAEAPEHSLWLTFHPPEERWPSPRLETLAGLVPGREVVLATPRGDEPHLARFAEALSELLGARATLRAEGTPRPPGLEPLVLRFDGSPASERKLVEILGMAEAFALGAPGR
jgi:hypothetical protein